MAKCPSCQSELNDDFGLVDCAQCGAALFLEMDGEVRLRDGSAPIEEVALNPAPPVLMGEPEPIEAQDLLHDLEEFGNSQIAGGLEGSYFYDVVISGIDSADLRKEVQEALTDRLFLWDAEVLLREVKLGELLIPRMNSVKAAMVVQRLTGLPVKIKWTQHALTQA